MSQLYPGDLLENRYRIGARIARGGMSTVYTAVDTRLDREVAVKVMDTALAGERAFRARFEREARAVAKLNHPALVNVFDQGVDGEFVFLVMELVVGGSLRELLKERGPMPPHAALAVMEPVLTALSVAHATGMIHRDIKPDNVLISDTHQVKLADFGLVRAIASGTNASSPTSADGKIIGTVGYLSPEQVRGEPLGQSSDVYSAGVLLFELLTGTTPFKEDSPVATAMARLHCDVDYPSQHIAGIPPTVDDLVAQATARNPHDRFADGAEFLDAVHKATAELRLPQFSVPAPEDSAVRRALADADFGDRLSWDDESMSTRAVHLDEPDTRRYPVDQRPQQTAHTQLQPAQSHAPHAGYLPADAHNPAAAYPMGVAYPAQQSAAPSAPDALEPGYGLMGYPAAPMHQPDGQQLASNHSTAHPAAPLTNRSPLRTVMWVLVLLALVATIAVGSWWLTSGRYGQVPQIIGMDQTTAQATIEDAGFTSGVSERYSDDRPAHSVLGSDPPFGQQAPLGSQVAVLVSLGKPTVPTPGITDTVDTYVAKLSDRTLSHTMGDEVYSNDTPKGRIARLNPPAGQEVPTGSKVTVHLSKGPAPVTVPGVEGQTEQRARQSLEAAGLRIGKVEREFSARVERDHAIRTTPDSGQSIPGGTEVTLVVSNAITVPDVTGLSTDEALKALRESGLNPRVGSTVGDDAVDAGHVAQQHPTAGTRVDPAKDTNITIHPSDTVSVPFVLGSRADEARRKLEEMGLDVTIQGSSDGVVYSQSPRPGSTARQGDKVTLRTL